MPFEKGAWASENDITNLPCDKQSGLAAAPAGRPPSAHINLCWVCPVTCASCPEADQWELRLGKSPFTMLLLSSDQRGFSRSKVARDSSTLRQRKPAAPFVSFPWIFISSCTSFYLTNTAGSCTKSLHQQTCRDTHKNTTNPICLSPGCYTLAQGFV